MRTAILDCGTNTFNLLIRESNTLRMLHNSKLPVRLAEGRDEAKNLSEEAMERALKALSEHLATAQQHQAQVLYAVGTEGLRSAKNKELFLARAAQLGVHINLIDGHREAELIYQGVKQGIELEDPTTLIMDIGGGSTEFILLRNKVPVWKESFAIGSSFLLNHFRPADPILEEEIETINEYFNEQLDPLLQACRTDTPRILIGSSGSFDTFARLCVENFQTSYLEMEDTHYTFALHEYMQMSACMIAATYEERLNTPGMEPIRADMMVMAALIINFIVKRLGIKKIQQCNYALKEGLFFDLQQNPQAWQKSSL